MESSHHKKKLTQRLAYDLKNFENYRLIALI